VSEIREREEGLFTTQGLTRALCLTAFVTWIVSVAAFFLFAYLVLRGELDSQAWRVLAIGFYFGIPTLVSVAILWSWRRCRRCSRRLFSDARPNPGLDAQSSSSVRRMWWLSWIATVPERHYRAKTLLGSYRNAALVSIVLKGRLHCQWCGHEDGVVPQDYIVR
jgi:hypothetical protein